MGRVARYKARKQAPARPAPPEADRLTALPPSRGDESGERIPRALARIIAGKGKATAARGGKRPEGEGVPEATASAARGGSGWTGDAKRKGGGSDTAGAGAASGGGGGGGRRRRGGGGGGGMSGGGGGGGGGVGGGGGGGAADTTAISEMRRMPKETLADFGKRVDRAAADQVYSAARRASNRVAKRREWAASKEQRKRERKLKAEEKERLKHQNDDALHRVEEIRFGEVAQAPPQIKAKPRHADKNLRKDPLLLSKRLERHGASKATKVAPVRQQALDEERERVIAAYRASKAARA